LPIGAIVELPGVIEKTTIDSIIDCFAAADILMGMGDSQTSIESGQHRGKQGLAHMARSLKSEIARLVECLDQDRKRTPISNMRLKSEAPGLGVVVSLRRLNLRDLTLSELNKNNIRVIGKVTRIIPAGETMMSF
jgi:hypothetical protein